MIRSRRTSTTTAALALGLALVLAACGGGESESEGGAGPAAAPGEQSPLEGATITVGSKEFTESILLGKITGQVLEAAGAQVTDKTGISGSATVRAALEAKEIDLYWDYTGTGWVNILGNSPSDVPDDLYQAVSTEDREKNAVAWLPPAPFENSYAMAVTAEYAGANGLTTLSDAVAHFEANPQDSVVCAASEFLNRDDGLPGFEKAYGIDFGKVNELDFNLIFTQIGESCPIGEVTTTDGRVLARDLQVLEDDKDFFLEYRGAVTLRQETLDRYPAVAEVLAPVGEKLTNEVITQLNSRIDVDGEQPEDVAQEWLEEQGLVG